MSLQKPIRTLKKLADPKILVKSTWLFGLVTLFLAMYGPRLHPKLPNSLRNLFKNPLFNALVIFLIIYMGSRDMATSLVITIIFIVTLTTITTGDLMGSIKKLMLMESFVNQGKSLDSTFAEKDKRDSEVDRQLQESVVPGLGSDILEGCPLSET